ncbi:LamG domain-containing protein [Nanoarchaeota archaeon]
MSRHLEFFGQSSLSRSKGSWRDYSVYQNSFWRNVQQNQEKRERKRRFKIGFSFLIIALIFGAFLLYGTNITGNVTYQTGIFGGQGSGGATLRHTGTYQQGSGEASSDEYTANIGWLAKTTEGNNAPTQDNPLVNSTTGANYTSENLTCYPQNLDDIDGDAVYPIFNWLKNGVSTTVLNMPFDTENSTVAKDYSGSGNDGILSGVVWTSDGRVGGAYDFTADYIDVGKDLSLNITGAITLEAWINTTLSVTTHLIGNFDAAGQNAQYDLAKDSNNRPAFLSCKSGSCVQISGTTTSITLGQWTHVVATRDSAEGTVTLYVNGIADDNTAISAASKIGLFTSSTNTAIGRAGSAYTVWPFTGRMDGVRIYNVSLSAEQVYQNFLEGNNSLNTSTIHSSETTVGENWTCEVTPNDLEVDGGLNVSNNLTVLAAANTAPQITAIEISSSITPEEAGVVNVSVNFTVLDTDGFGDVNVSTAQINFSRGSEPLRENTSCLNVSSAGNYMNFSCIVGMYYFDEAGSWNITATVSDESWENATNDSVSFTYESFAAIVMSPASINWFEITRGSSNQLPDSNLTINHTGNAVISNISVSAVNLTGEQDGNYIIYAENFSVSSNLGAACSGDSLIQDTFVNVTGSSLTRGNLSEGGGVAQEELAYCLTETSSELIKQAYSTALSRAWYIKVIAALAVFTLKRKKRNKLLKKLDLELRKEYGIELDEVVEQINKIKDKGQEKLTIPVTVFASDLGPAETLVKYMKENLDLRFSQISNIIKRDDGAIWKQYNNTKRKKLKLAKTDVIIPISIFRQRKLSVLESLIIYLRDKGLSNIEVSRLLDKDPRNIYTVYARAKIKLTYLDETPTDLIKQDYSIDLSNVYFKKNKLLKGLDLGLKKEYGIELDEVVEQINKIKDKEQEKLIIPVTAFASDLGPAETLVKYMKENLDLRLSQISSIIKRDDGAIWKQYNNNKRKKLKIAKTDVIIPISIFRQRKLSVLESLIIYLRDKGLSNIEVSRLLDKDPRNIYTVYARAKMKLIY